MDADRRFTPAVIVRALESLCGQRFALDVAAESTPGGHVCERFFTRVDDGLSRSWGKPGEMAWCNPPYSEKDRWIAKARTEAARGVKVWLWLPLTADPSRQALARSVDALVMAGWRVRYVSPCGLPTDSPNAVVQAGFGLGVPRGVWQICEDGAVVRLGGGE
jgi:phage N-6-adenine-methyltransferase